MYSNFLVILFQYLFKKGCVFCVPQNVHILPTQNPPPHSEPSPWNRLLTTNLTSTMAPIWPFSPLTVLKAFVTNSFRLVWTKKHPLTILKLQVFFVVVFSPQFLHQSCHAPHPTPHPHLPSPTDGFGFTKKRDLPASNLHQRIGPFPWSLPAGNSSCHGRTPPQCHHPPIQKIAGRP